MERALAQLVTRDLHSDEEVDMRTVSDHWHSIINMYKEQKAILEAKKPFLARIAQSQPV